MSYIHIEKETPTVQLKSLQNYPHYMSKTQPPLSFIHYAYTWAHATYRLTWQYCEKIDSRPHLEPLTNNRTLCTPILRVQWCIQKARATLDLFLVGKICYS
jgi:hypothetical protein